MAEHEGERSPGGEDADEANPDPLTGTPGSHPMGVSVGAASGAAVGAVIGAAAGPAGAVAGTLVGAVAGALAGRGAVEALKPTFPRANSPHSHDLGAGLGAAGGGAVGAALGSLVGPVGTLVGSVVGAVAGGIAGEGVADVANPGAEDEYWREAHAGRPYVAPGTPYETYRDAYRFGWEAQERHSGRRFDEVEVDLRREWQESGAEDALEWSLARFAARDAWERLAQRSPRARRPAEADG